MLHVLILLAIVVIVVATKGFSGLVDVVVFGGFIVFMVYYLRKDD